MSNVFKYAGRFEDGAAELDDVAYVLGAERFDFAVQEPSVAVIDALDLETVVKCGACHRPDGGVHAGGIASGRQDAYAVNTEHIVSVFSKYPLLRGARIMQASCSSPRGGGKVPDAKLSKIYEEWRAVSLFRR